VETVLRRASMMYIEVNKYDKHYPYTISDSWGGRVYMTEEGLKKLQEEIKKVLDKPAKA
jgi:hypothetical protein